MRKVIVAATLLSLSVLTGCAPAAIPANGEKIDNNKTFDNTEYGMLVYRATGTTGDGADDAEITIMPPEGSSGEAVIDYATLVPWTMYGGDFVKLGDKVSMTVASLSSDGTASCEVSFQNITIRNTVSGDHPVAICEGTLALED